MINNELPIWLEEANDLSRPLIGKLMTDSFNEAFDKKEMASSQKQAVIRK